MAGSTTGIFATPAPDRPWYQRWTMLGVAIVVALRQAEAAGFIPEGTMQTAAGAGQVFGGFLTAAGLYRHIPTT